MEGPGPYRAVRDLLMRRTPRVAGNVMGERLVRDGESPLDAARRIALALDETVLPIQGPPGTGKTYTGARMIVELVRRGKRVGIAAQSHKAISNLLREVCEAAATEGRRLPGHPEVRQRRRCRGPRRRAGRHRERRRGACAGRWRGGRGGGNRLALRARADGGDRRRRVRRRGGPDVAGERRRDGGRARRSSCSATRTSCRWSARASTPTVPEPLRWSTCWMAPPPWTIGAACSSARRGGCTPTSTTTSRPRSTPAAWTLIRRRASSASRPTTRRSTVPASASCRCPMRAMRRARARRRTGSRTSSLGSSGSRGPTATG